MTTQHFAVNTALTCGEKLFSYRDRKQESFVGLAVYNPKGDWNVATLYRTAATLGNVNFLATIGEPYYEHKADTLKSRRYVPSFNFKDFRDFLDHMPAYCQMVAVEQHPKAKNILKWKPPQRVIYVLGGETDGIPERVLKSFQKKVYIPSKLNLSLNLGVAGSIILWNHYQNEQRSLI